MALQGESIKIIKDIQMSLVEKPGIYEIKIIKCNSDWLLLKVSLLASAQVIYIYWVFFF